MARKASSNSRLASIEGLTGMSKTALQKEWVDKFLNLGGFILVALDSEGKTVYINRYGAELLGYEEAELLGRDWFETCLPKNIRTEIKQLFLELVAGGIEPPDYFDNPVITKSGDHKYISWHNTVLRDESGMVTGTLSSGLDVTAQKQAEQTVRSREAQLTAVLETAVDGIITIDANGIIRSINSAVINQFGYSREELIGKKVNILMASPHREEHDRYIRRYLETGIGKIIGIGREVTGRRKDGSLFPLRLSVSEFDLNGQTMFAGIVHDITEQKDLQEKILQTERLAVIGKMAAKVAHEIRNPLSSISLNAELLDEEIANQHEANVEESQSLIQSMIREIDRVTSLTEEYLQFSRLPESRPIKGSYEELVAEVLDFLSEELRQKNIDVRVRQANPAFLVALDQAQFRRVLLNLVLNALDSMPEGGKLTISTLKRENWGVISVEDTGCGIPDDEVERIFEPFFTTKAFGTGLGLAISQQVVNEHSGHIICKSQVGKGTTFTVLLPLYETT